MFQPPFSHIFRVFLSSTCPLSTISLYHSEAEGPDNTSHILQAGGSDNLSKGKVGGKTSSSTCSSISNRRRHQCQKRAQARLSENASQKSEIFEALDFEEDSSDISSSQLSVLFCSRDSTHEKDVLGTFRNANDPIFQSYKCLSSPGTVYVVDKATLYIHLVARITPFSTMSSQDRDEFQTVFSHLKEDSKFKYNITRNGAMQNGKMFRLGWRAGYNEGYSMGTYAAKSTFLEKRNMQDQWKILKTQEKKVHDIYGKRFCSLASSLYNNTAEFMALNSLPYIGYRYDEGLPEDSESYLFASNLIYTISKFLLPRYYKY